MKNTFIYMITFPLILLGGKDEEATKKNILDTEAIKKKIRTVTQQQQQILKNIFTDKSELARYPNDSDLKLNINENTLRLIQQANYIQKEKEKIGEDTQTQRAIIENEIKNIDLGVLFVQYEFLHHEQEINAATTQGLIFKQTALYNNLTIEETISSLKTSVNIPKKSRTPIINNIISEIGKNKQHIKKQITELHNATVNNKNALYVFRQHDNLFDDTAKKSIATLQQYQKRYYQNCKNFTNDLNKLTRQINSCLKNISENNFLKKDEVKKLIPSTDKKTDLKQWQEQVNLYEETHYLQEKLTSKIHGLITEREALGNELTIGRELLSIKRFTQKNKRASIIQETKNEISLSEKQIWEEIADLERATRINENNLDFLEKSGILNGEIENETFATLRQYQADYVEDAAEFTDHMKRLN